MHRTADSEVNRQQLMRIVALLVSFAALAERVACLPPPVRVAVMFFLRPAESVARAFVAGLCGPSGPMSIASNDDAASAIGLADRFRALAAVLAAVAAGLSVSDRPGASSAPGRRGALALPAGRPAHAFAAPHPFDTS